MFAYYYKALLCGFLGRIVGLDFLCLTWIRGISTNHWFEIVVYCPMLWLALHQVNTDVFGDVPLDIAERRRRRLRKLVGEFGIALVIYGMGVHIANVIEIYSRERQGIESGKVYGLIYFLDEGVSHYIQFIPLFFVIGWFVINDRLPRDEHPHLASFFGVGHGVERAIGIIEGSKWFLGPPTVLWLAFALAVRLERFRRAGVRPWDDFFVRYAIGFCVTLPITQLMYFGYFGSFDQPSNLEGGQSVIAGGAIALTIGGTALLIGSECWRRLRPRATPGPPPTG